MTNAVSEYIKAVQLILASREQNLIHVNPQETAMLEIVLEKIDASLRNQWKDRDDDRDVTREFDNED